MTYLIVGIARGVSLVVIQVSTWLFCDTLCRPWVWKDKTKSQYVCDNFLWLGCFGMPRSLQVVHNCLFSTRHFKDEEHPRLSQQGQNKHCMVICPFAKVTRHCINLAGNTEVPTLCQLRPMCDPSNNQHCSHRHTSSMSSSQAVAPENIVWFEQCSCWNALSIPSWDAPV